jgi:Protein of unknown function (DUF1638)
MTDSSTSSPSRPDRRPVAVIACGALAQDVARIADRHGWPVVVHPLPPLLHNRPHRIAPAVATLATQLRERYQCVAVAYADCGTYGSLDEVCDRFGLARLRGAHCYDVFAGPARLRSLLEREPGTYVLTDFLVRSFARAVVGELGLDRYPELRADYFRHYRRAVWLAQRATPELAAQAQAAADTLGLPLTVVHVGDVGLERELRRLIRGAGATVERSSV